LHRLEAEERVVIVDVGRVGRSERVKAEHGGTKGGCDVGEGKKEGRGRRWGVNIWRGEADSIIDSAERAQGRANPEGLGLIGTF